MFAIKSTKEQFLSELALAALGLSLFSLHFSPALSSISLVMALLLGVVAMLREHREEQKSGISKFTIPGLILVLYLLWQLSVSMYFADNLADTFPKITLKLPLIGLSVFVFIYLKSKRFVNEWIAFFNLSFSWLALSSVIHYFRNYTFLNAMVLESKPLPLYSQVYHIEFSLMLAIASLAGLWRILFYRHQTKSFVRSLLWVTVALNIICLHILSARTGMLAFWAGSCVLLYYKVKSTRFQLKWLLLLPVVGLSMVLIPSVKNRLVNTWQDFYTVATGADVNNKSFGQRWKAWEMSVHILAENPLGVGWTSVNAKMNEMFERKAKSIKPENRIMPHNQFLDSAVQSGWPGLLLLIAFFVFTAAIGLRNGNVFLLSVLLSLFFAMLFESILERQSGVLIFVIAVALGMAFSDFQKNIAKNL